jgi:hypothetical protein
MLTLVESISLAGDRGKQNDDACGFAHGRAWVIDGATDLYDDSLMGAATDAAWIAHALNAVLHADAGDNLRALVASAATTLCGRYEARGGDLAVPGWRRPAASLVIARETAAGLDCLDLGDSRLFARDATGALHTFGGDGENAVREAARARAVIGTGAKASPLSRADVREALRTQLARRNTPGGVWCFGVEAACAEHARTRALQLARPAHILLATDGFAALCDRYQACAPEAFLDACITRGLESVAAELRALERDDALGARHARYKKSDDATAMLLRLT